MRDMFLVFGVLVASVFAEGRAFACSQAVALVEALMGFEADQSYWLLKGRVQRNDDDSFK